MSRDSSDDLPSDWLPILLEFYENEEAAEWLNAPHEMLGGEVPLDVIRDGRQEEVAEIVHLLESGAYV